MVITARFDFTHKGIHSCHGANETCMASDCDYPYTQASRGFGADGISKSKSSGFRFPISNSDVAGNAYIQTYRAKHLKGSKQRYLLGQDKTSKFSQNWTGKQHGSTQNR